MRHLEIKIVLGPRFPQRSLLALPQQVMSPKKGAQGPAAGRMPTKTVEPEGEEDELW